jgi:hypothetical protein
MMHATTMPINAPSAASFIIVVVGGNVDVCVGDVESLLSSVVALLLRRSSVPEADESVVIEDVVKNDVVVDVVVVFIAFVGDVAVVVVVMQFVFGDD